MDTATESQVMGMMEKLRQRARGGPPTSSEALPRASNVERSGDIQWEKPDTVSWTVRSTCGRFLIRKSCDQPAGSVLPAEFLYSCYTVTDAWEFLIGAKRSFAEAKTYTQQWSDSRE